MQIFDGPATSPRVEASISVTALRSRGWPSGGPYDNNDSDRVFIARRMALPKTLAGARRTSGLLGANSRLPRGTSSGNSARGAARSSKPVLSAREAGDSLDVKRRGFGSGKSVETNAPRAR